MLIPVILSGGAGTRLWPVSREAFPKPFINLVDGESLIEKTLIRALSISGVEEILTVTNNEYFFQTRALYSGIETEKEWRSDWLLEPVSRNTAPALVSAALHIKENYGKDAIMLVLPADHLIHNTSGFNDSVEKAKLMAAEGYIVTFGIKPTRAEGDFGYLQLGDKLAEGFLISSFLEKPGVNKANELIENGNYYWNSGMFCMRTDVVLEEFAKHASELFKQAEFSRNNSNLSETPVLLNLETFSNLPNISFDYAVMERTAKAAVIIANFDWNDVGSWEAMSSLGGSDEKNNITEGQSLILRSENCYFRSDERLIAAIGLDNIFVIDTPDALLVAHRNSLQEVKEIALELKKRNHSLYRLHQTVHRPWGSYTILEEGERFKIKRIVVKPGQKLSSQLHHHRNEHWIVVSGTAMVTNGNTDKLLLTNQSTYIEAGVKHRLENPGIKDLVLIEVQSGEYLGEDDIVRFEDSYGRT